MAEPQTYKIYTGQRDFHSDEKRLTVLVKTVRGNETIETKELTPNDSQKVVNHSPDGFEWGYGGSGPAQLALAILLDYTDNEVRSVVMTEDFKWSFVANARREGFQINAREIDEFMEKFPKAF